MWTFLSCCFCLSSCRPTKPESEDANETTPLFDPRAAERARRRALIAYYTAEDITVVSRHHPAHPSRRTASAPNLLADADTDTTNSSSTEGHTRLNLHANHSTPQVTHSESSSSTDLTSSSEETTYVLPSSFNPAAYYEWMNEAFVQEVRVCKTGFAYGDRANSDGSGGSGVIFSDDELSEEIEETRGTREIGEVVAY